MVKPLNKEWELFGRKYRIPGAKGEKVDCNACQKQVSAAVNRLQSHLRVCPARPHLLSASGPSGGSELNSTNGTNGLEEIGDGTDLNETVLESAATAAGVTTLAGGVQQPPKRYKTSSPSRIGLKGDRRYQGYLEDAFAAQNTQYAKRRLEIEEKRLELELRKEKREQEQAQFQLEILRAQSQKERILLDKETFDAKVALALSRKQLRDQGVEEEEIDRILPVNSNLSI